MYKYIILMRSCNRRKHLSPLDLYRHHFTNAELCSACGYPKITKNILVNKRGGQFSHWGRITDVQHWLQPARGACTSSIFWCERACVWGQELWLTFPFSLNLAQGREHLCLVSASLLESGFCCGSVTNGWSTGYFHLAVLRTFCSSDKVWCLTVLAFQNRTFLNLFLSSWLDTFWFSVCLTGSCF